MELDTLGDRKTALFLIMSDTDTTFNFVIAMLQSQLFNLLCDKADDEYGGSCRFMYGVSWMSSPTLDRYQTLIN